MAADVTSLNNPNSEALITRDLLANLTKVCNPKMEVESQIPDDLQTQLLFKKGKMYQEGLNSPSPTCSSSFSSSTSKNKQKKNSNSSSQTFQALNDPASSTPPLSLITEQGTCKWDLKLESSTRYDSVCTLDKVKSALERAEKEDKTKKLNSSSLSPPLNEEEEAHQEEEERDRGQRKSWSSDMFPACCPGCLFYVIILKENPKCPHCNCIVPSPSPAKKPRFDLNASFS